MSRQEEEEGDFGDLFGPADVSDGKDTEAASSSSCIALGVEDIYPSSCHQLPAVVAAMARARSNLIHGGKDADNKLILHHAGQHHSLWGHQVWNAAKLISRMMIAGTRRRPETTSTCTVSATNGAADDDKDSIARDEHELCQLSSPWPVDVWQRSVVELGAGMGLPSFVAHGLGARLVVTTDYPDDALLDPLKRTAAAVEQAKIAAAGAADASTDQMEHSSEQEETMRARSQGYYPTKLVVEPLRWGSDTNIQQVLSHSGGTGFDIVILSDIVFNHVCHRDLLKTVSLLMQKDRRAAAYCAFSHHRPHKQQDDLAFFGLCGQFGLAVEKLGESAEYPLMFPDDPGPAEIRAPVHCYKLSHFFDEAGPPLDVSATYDCVVQGTGLTEALVSAGLSRFGLKVLHLDHCPQYGGLFASLSATQFVEHISEYCSAVQVAYPRPSKDKDAQQDDVPSSSSSTGGRQTVVKMSFESLGITQREDRQFVVDVVPQAFMARSGLLSKVADSQVAKHFELFNVEHLVVIETEEGEGSKQEASSSGGQKRGFNLQTVPLTRSDVFKASWLSPLEVRRLMKFMKDVEARVAELEHADPSSSSTNTAATFAAQPWSTATPTDDFCSFLKRKYNLAPKTIDMITLCGALQAPGTGAKSIELSFSMLRTFLTSVGRYGGTTPFLLPMYGCSELPQSMCRVSAVWNGTFVLRRHVTKIETSDDKTFVWLSNGQRIEATCVALPKELVAHASSSSSSSSDDRDRPEDVKLSRVVALLRRPLFSSKLDLPKSDDEAADEDDESDDEVKTVVAAWRVPVAAASASSASVVVQQVGKSTYQAGPSGFCVVHFTSDASLISSSDLLRAVSRTFFVASLEVEEGTREPYSNLVLLCAFEVSAEAMALHSCGGIVPQVPLPRSQHSENEGSRACDHAATVQHIQTLFHGLDDGQYCAEAERAFKQMVKKCRAAKHDGASWSKVSIEAYKQNNNKVAEGEKTTLPNASTAVVVDDTKEDEPIFLEEVVDVNDVSRVGEGDREAELLKLV